MAPPLNLLAMLPLLCSALTSSSNLSSPDNNSSSSSSLSSSLSPSSASATFLLLTHCDSGRLLQTEARWVRATTRDISATCAALRLPLMGGERVEGRAAGEAEKLWVVRDMEGLAWEEEGQKDSMDTLARASSSALMELVTLGHLSLPCDHIPWLSPYSLLICSLCLASLCLFLLLGLLIEVFRKTKFIAFSQRFFLHLFSLGGVAVTLSSLSFIGKTAAWTCSLRAACVSISTSLMFATLFLKLRRGLRLLSGGCRRLVLSNSRLAIEILGAVLVDIVLLILWHIVGVDRPHTVFVSYSFPSTSDLPLAEIPGTQCDGPRSTLFLSLLFIWKLVLLIFGLWICYRTRSNPEARSQLEWREVASGILLGLLVLFAAVLIGGLLTLPGTGDRLLVFSLVCVLLGPVVVLTVLVPKVYFLLTNPAAIAERLATKEAKRSVYGLTLALLYKKRKATRQSRSTGISTAEGETGGEGPAVRAVEKVPALSRTTSSSSAYMRKVINAARVSKDKVSPIIIGGGGAEDKDRQNGGFKAAAPQDQAAMAAELEELKRFARRLSTVTLPATAHTATASGPGPVSLVQSSLANTFPSSSAPISAPSTSSTAVLPYDKQSSPSSQSSSS